MMVLRGVEYVGFWKNICSGWANSKGVRGNLRSNSNRGWESPLGKGSGVCPSFQSLSGRCSLSSGGEPPRVSCLTLRLWGRRCPTAIVGSRRDCVWERRAYWFRKIWMEKKEITVWGKLQNFFHTGFVSSGIYSIISWTRQCKMLHKSLRVTVLMGLLCFNRSNKLRLTPCFWLSL